MKFIIKITLTLLLTTNFAHAGSELVDNVLKFGAVGAALIPFKFSAQKLAIGGLANLTTQTGANVIDDGKNGFGAFASYELTNFEAEAYIKRLQFDSFTSYTAPGQSIWSEAKTLSYSFGLRLPFFKFLSIKAGYSLHEVKYEEEAHKLNLSKEENDRGFYYGSGIRVMMNQAFSIYTDVLGHYFQRAHIHVIEAELGLRYAF